MPNGVVTNGYITEYSCQYPTTTQTGTPATSQTYIQNQTLYADGSGIQDADGLGSFKTQWQRSSDGKTWQNIAAATDTGYTLTGTDVGQRVRAVISYTDGGGTQETVYSSASPLIASLNHTPTGTLTLSGSVQQNQTVTLDTLALRDADGLGQFSYQWQVDGRVIGGASGKSYTLTEAEVGRNIRGVVTYTDGKGTPEQILSTAIGPVANVNDAPTGRVTIEGEAKLGETVSGRSTLADADGLGTITYQWLANGVVLKGASEDHLALTRDLVGKTLQLRASYVDGHGTAERVSSEATAAVVSVNSPPSGNLSLRGEVAQNQSLSINQTLTDADGVGTLTYQWLADAVIIPGATGTSYRLTQTEVGKHIGVIARYTDGEGNAESVTSGLKQAVANVNDAPTGQVTINGKPQVGQVLTVSQSVQDADGLGRLHYEWQAGETVVGTDERYTLTRAEVGKNVRVSVYYTDGQGTAERVSSAPTGLVTAVASIVKGTTGNDKWLGTGQDDRYDGLAGHDTISGFAGNDSLIGNTGNDSIDGAVGNDTLQGNDGNDTLTGGSGHDRLDGGADRDILDGGPGNDSLDGGLNSDTLRGGEGDDVYWVDNFRDEVIELAGSLGGNDTVRSERTYVLPANVENLILTGLQALQGTGNDGKNFITGNS
ncbi:MAG: hypothetical protein ACR2HF_09305, partial [Methylococcaceae bacterium]